VSDKGKARIEIRIGPFKVFEMYEEYPKKAQEYVCERDHGDIGRDVLEIRAGDVSTGPLCLRCIANMLSCCRATPEEDVGYGGE
jgi:hypothetical protein